LAWEGNIVGKWLCRLFTVIALPALAVMAPHIVRPAEAQTVLKMGHCCPNETSGTGQGLVKWSELVAQRTDGRVKIEVFPSLQLGSEPQMLEGMRLGTVDGGVLTDANFQALVPDFGAINLPFAFANYDEAHHFLDGAKPILLKKLEKTGVVGFAFADVGFRSIGNNRGPIKTLADLKGLKIRIVPSPMLTDTMNALGARGIPMGGDQIATAMMQGIIDGVELGHIYFVSIKTPEYTKYFSATREVFSSAVFAMSKSSFDSLSPTDQKIVADAAQEAASFASDYTAREEAKVPQILTTEGMKVNDVDPSFTEDARKAVDSVWAKYTQKLDPQLVALLKPRS
jgi:TRAP-type transport system periplasmic protein